jgi:hypothetical protein
VSQCLVLAHYRSLQARTGLAKCQSWPPSVERDEKAEDPQDDVARKERQEEWVLARKVGALSCAVSFSGVPLQIISGVCRSGSQGFGVGKIVRDSVTDSVKYYGFRVHLNEEAVKTGFKSSNNLVLTGMFLA